MNVSMKESGAVHVSVDADLMERWIAAEASKEGLTADEYLDKYYGSSSDEFLDFPEPDSPSPNQPECQSIFSVKKSIT